MKFLNITDQELLELGKTKSHDYQAASPFPSGYFDNIFSTEMLDKILDELPDLKHDPSLKYNDLNQVKLACNVEERFGETTKLFMHYLNSQPFLNFLSALTGIENLIPDPYFLGGGYHQTLPGGFLKVHADFNKQPRNKLDRRLNVLVYLNKDWEDAYGGHLQLWDKEMKECKVKISPVFNRMAMFSTTSFSYHGLPDPLSCPPDRSRKSLALYYYSNGRPASEINDGLEEHTTLFKYRPGLDDDTKNKSRINHFIELITPPIIYYGIKNLLAAKEAHT